MTNFFEEIEEKGIPYRKKRNKKGKSKADHKHDYEEVIGLIQGKYGWQAVKAKECLKCGKFEFEGFFIVKEDGPYSRHLSDLEEIKRIFPHLRVVKKDGFVF